MTGTEQGVPLTFLDILLSNQSDRGCLNNKDYIHYRGSDRISLRSGPHDIVNEHSADQKLNFGNDRFPSVNTRLRLVVAYHF